MNKKKVAAATTDWIAAQQKKKRARTDRDAFWATRDIAKALPVMIEAYAAPAEQSQGKVQAENKTELVDEDDESTRKRFDYYCIPASPAMHALVDAVWIKWVAHQRLFSRLPEVNDKFLLATCLSNIANAELADPEVEGVTISR